MRATHLRQEKDLVPVTTAPPTHYLLTCVQSLREPTTRPHLTLKWVAERSAMSQMMTWMMLAVRTGLKVAGVRPNLADVKTFPTKPVTGLCEEEQTGSCTVAPINWWVKMLSTFLQQVALDTGYSEAYLRPTKSANGNHGLPKEDPGDVLEIRDLNVNKTHSGPRGQLSNKSPRDTIAKTKQYVTCYFL